MPNSSGMFRLKSWCIHHLNRIADWLFASRCDQKAVVEMEPSTLVEGFLLRSMFR